MTITTSYKFCIHNTAHTIIIPIHTSSSTMSTTCKNVRISIWPEYIHICLFYIFPRSLLFSSTSVVGTFTTGGSHTDTIPDEVSSVHKALHTILDAVFCPWTKWLRWSVHTQVEALICKGRHCLLKFHFLVFFLKRNNSCQKTKNLTLNSSQR